MVSNGISAIVSNNLSVFRYCFSERGSQGLQHYWQRGELATHPNSYFLHAAALMMGSGCKSKHNQPMRSLELMSRVAEYRIIINNCIPTVYTVGIREGASYITRTPKP